MRTDLEYAIEQLRGGRWNTVVGHDRVQRAMDAMERVLEAVKALEADVMWLAKEYASEAAVERVLGALEAEPE